MEIPTISSDLNTDPTIDELKIETAKAPEPTGPENKIVENEPASKTPEPNPDDFAPKQPEPIPAPLQQPVQMVQPVSPMKKKLSAETSAQIIVGFENSLMEAALPSLYKKYIFTTDERKRIRELKSLRVSDPNFKPDNDTDAELLSRYKDYSDLKDLAGMDKDEKARMVEVWDQIIKENQQLALSPWQALIGIHIEIIGPRLLPLLNKLSF